MTDYFGDIVIPDTLATTDDLAAWMSTDAPANATAILRACTVMVIDACEGSFYSTDPATGIATDTTIQTAMKNAVLDQAAAWVTLKIDPFTGGVATLGTATSKKIGSAQITYDGTDAAAAAAARAAAFTSLVPQAVKRLQQVNLLGTNPWYYG